MGLLRGSYEASARLLRGCGEAPLGMHLRDSCEANVRLLRRFYGLLRGSFEAPVGLLGGCCGPPAGILCGSCEASVRLR